MSKIIIEDEMPSYFIYQPSFKVTVAGDFSQTEILQIKSAVNNFSKIVRPILEHIEKRRLATKEKP